MKAEYSLDINYLATFLPRVGEAWLLLISIQY